MIPHKFVPALCASLIAGGALAETPKPPHANMPVQNASQSRQTGKTQKSAQISTEPISIEPLGSEQTDAIGILNSDQTGIPRNFWGDSNPQTIAQLIRPYFPTAVPEITGLWQRIALTEIDAPSKAATNGEVLLARLDHLIKTGALDQAEALVERAGNRSPDLVRRSFEIGLLTGRAETACDDMLHNPSLTPGLKARIFCLARAGDWGAAAITLTTAQSLRKIPYEDAELLARFLDPELYEDEPEPPAPNPLTPLDFVMREALGLPRNGQALPLAYLHMDLDGPTGWRNQVMATERLTRAQAVPHAKLIQLYQDGTPAASGGIWVRVDAVQKLSNAIQAQDNKAASKALITAYDQLGKAGLSFALTDMAAEQLRHMDLDETAASVRFRLWLLHKDYRSLTTQYTPQTHQEQFLMAIAQEQWQEISPKTDIEAAIHGAFTGTELRNGVLWDASQGRLGEAVFKSLTTLVKTYHGDPGALETALSVLLIAGLKDEARRIALQVSMQKYGLF